MKILFFGDVVGKPGRQALQQVVPKLRAKHGVDLVIANVENSAHGFGITPDVINELQEAGVDLFTSGNHVWKNLKGVELLESDPEHILVPENYVQDRPGRGYAVATIANQKILLINLIGRVFMDGETLSPFAAFDAIAQEHGDDAIIIVDLHAEATGEKRAFGWYVDGRAHLVVGTHTHVQTADNHILPNGTAYITDLGMCGATDSSLGMDKRLVIQKVALGKEVHLEPPSEPAEAAASGVLVTIDPAANKATAIERIDERVSLA